MRVTVRLSAAALFSFLDDKVSSRGSWYYAMIRRWDECI